MDSQAQIQDNSVIKRILFIGLSIFLIVSLVILTTQTSFNNSTTPFKLFAKDSFDRKFVQDLFQQWKFTYGKEYDTVQNEDRKFEIFFDHYIENLNWNANPKHTSTMGLNQFSDLTNEEFRQQISCLKDSKSVTEEFIKTNHAQGIFVTDIEDPPRVIDWRQQGAVTGVKNQGQCGSCWAFSTSGSLEGFAFIQTKNLQSFSEQQLVDCAGAYYNLGCQGGWMFWAMNYTAHQGIELESVYPYVAQNQPCKWYKGNVVFQNKMYQNVTPLSMVALQTAIAQQPVAVAVDGGSSTFQSYSGGIISDASCGVQLDHGVLAVGYNQNQMYWIVKNSWGANWGESGFVRIGMNGDGEGICGIQQVNSYPI